MRLHYLSFRILQKTVHTPKLMDKAKCLVCDPPLQIVSTTQNCDCYLMRVNYASLGQEVSGQCSACYLPTLSNTSVSYNN